MYKIVGIYFDINYDIFWYLEWVEIRVRVKWFCCGFVVGIWNYKFYRFFILKLWLIIFNLLFVIILFFVDERYIFDLIYFRYVRWCDFLMVEGYNLGIWRLKSW